MPTRTPLLVVAWLLFVLVVYCPDIGRGFVKDDFTWIRAAKQAAAEPHLLVLPRDVGFYRPLVTTSFIADFRFHAWGARGYGWTNLALYIACAIAIALLALSIGLSRRAALLAAFVWAINPHGINMAIVWLSGRTSLFLTFFSVVAAAAFVRRRYISTAVLIALALASKEEAVMLPFVLLAWGWLRRRVVPLSAAAVVSLFLPLVVYIAVRSLTPAFTPATAPSFYQLAPAHVLRNIWQYLDRSVTIAAVVLLVSALVLRSGRNAHGDELRALAWLCLAWWVGMFAITMWLPVRSSLYAVCPSVASALFAAGLIDRLRVHASERARQWLEPVLALLLLMAVPAYRARNHTWVEGARVSQRTLATIRSDLHTLPATGTILLRDEPRTVSSFHNAFGDLATEAMQTVFDRPWVARVIDAASSDAVDRNGAIVEYRLERGRIVRTDLP